MPEDRALTDWAWVFEAAGLLGWPPETVLKATLPELVLALRGRNRALGLHVEDPQPQAMTRAELLTLIERHVT